MAYNAMPGFFVIDYSKHKYVAMSQGIRPVTGYHHQEFIDSGIEMIVHIYHPDDFKVYNEKVFIANSKFLNSVPRTEHSQYVFNYTFRIKDGRGGTTHLLQRGTYITCPESGALLYSIGMGININGLGDERRMFHSIEKSTGTGYSSRKEIVLQNYFYPYEEDSQLSNREKDILSYMADGLSIKQIAPKLGITENTIANHRKNMFYKTGTKNMAELVAFALRRHII